MDIPRVKLRTTTTASTATKIDTNQIGNQYNTNDSAMTITKYVLTFAKDGCDPIIGFSSVHFHGFLAMVRVCAQSMTRTIHKMTKRRKFRFIS
jgi:hypothetical protein